MIVRNTMAVVLALGLALTACAPAPTEGAPVAATARAPAPATPSERLGSLFEAVQANRLFPDSKTFADAVPKRDAAAIMADYRRLKPDGPEALAAFVAAEFEVPGGNVAPAPANDDRPPIADHIRALWPILTRETPTTPQDGSALSLPRPYVVPGGRFREIYYWDSYFTMLGLKRSGRQDLVESMIDDFGSLIDRYGHVPNGSRTYYLSRSQPPFFALMTRLSDRADAATLKRRTDWLRAEHAFWMDGEAGLRPGHEARRVVRLADGAVLNRYWDDSPTPRDESWREDVELARTAGRDPGELWRDIRAAAESGWDFSSRWLAPEGGLATIRTTRIAPVDLNSLMFGMERTIAENCAALGDPACADAFQARADARRTAIERHMWNDAGGFYADHDLDRDAASGSLTAAAAFPLFLGVASPERGRRDGAALEPLIRQGGLVTTLVDTGQQWDAPNGWAPLQWAAVAGLRAYGDAARADRIAQAWLSTVRREYDASGRLLEKYDVVEIRPGGGGEYPLQDGFGWTNGVTLELMATFP